MMLILWLTLLLLVLGITENIIHQRRLKKVPIRIHVNGTRGKSTTTRLIAGALREAGFCVIAKTTGTAARLILEDGNEVPIKRRQTPSISEQIKIVKEAARRQADILVIECMAINPEMQWVSEKRILQSTIGVITNVREDHLDEMGPTRQDVASVLALAIPKNGQLVLGEEDFAELFATEADKLGTSISLTDIDAVSEHDLNSFPYLSFKENVACALRVGELLNVPKDIALEGMYKVNPDLGATQLSKLKHSGVNIFLVNALAANDLASTLLVWEKWQSFAKRLSLTEAPIIGVLHNRADRSFRVEELVEVACTHIPFDYLWLTGDLIPLTKRYLKQRDFDLSKIKGFKRASLQRILDDIAQNSAQDVILFAYGNTKGFGQDLIDYFREKGEIVL